MDELIARIQFDHEKRQESRIYEALPISIFDPKIGHEKLTTDLKGNLVHSQLLINCLLRMQRNDSDKKELISNSKKIYQKNKVEMDNIDKFERTYRPEHALYWYVKESFLSRLLNKALRRQDIDILFLFQFFIFDVRQQLEKAACKQRITVYRSQLMSKNELQKLRNATGQFISINSFVSATQSQDRAFSFLKNDDSLERVMFEIDADPQRAKNKPFAKITSDGSHKEEEVLFMLGSIFEITKVDQKEGIWEVRLKLCSDDNLQLESIGDDNQKLLSFGHVLVTMGKVEEAEIYYRRLLEQLPKKHPDIARCFEALASIADEKGDYDASIELYHNAMEINNKVVGKQHLDVASNYNSIGEVYRKKGQYEEALNYYNNALEALGKNPTGKYLAKQAVCYNNIGIVYQEQQKYKEALEYYMKAFKIREKHCSSDETLLGMSNNNIGNAYYFLDLYDDAIHYYKEALKIYKRTLPPQHQKFASTYNNIGAIYDKQGKLEEALSYYQDAIKIYRTIHPASHPNVMKIDENIQRIKDKIKK